MSIVEVKCWSFHVGCRDEKCFISHVYITMDSTVWNFSCSLINARSSQDASAVHHWRMGLSGHHLKTSATNFYTSSGDRDTSGFCPKETELVASWELRDFRSRLRLRRCIIGASSRVQEGRRWSHCVVSHRKIRDKGSFVAWWSVSETDRTVTVLLQILFHYLLF